MYENTTEEILQAQNNVEDAMNKLVEKNSRTNLEHSKTL